MKLDYMKLIMPERLPMDGAVSVDRVDSDHLRIGESSSDTAVILSEYNAWRVFGMLSVMLGINLPSSIAKNIKL